MDFFELLSNVTWVSILLFLLGMTLLIVELYIPGFGLPGVAGIVSLIAFIFVTGQNAAQRLTLSGFLVVLCGIIFGIFFTLLSKRRLPKSLILETSEEHYAGVEDFSHLLGKTGIVLSTCRPAGNADFDGMKIDIVSRGEFIEKGAKIEVLEVEGRRIVVKEVSK